MRYVMLAFIVLLLHACARTAPAPVPGSALPTPSVATLPGSWKLIAVGGEDIPVAPVHDGRRLSVEVTASTFTITADGTFTMTMTYRNPSSGDSFSRNFEGTYVAAEGAYRFDWKDAGATRVWLDERRLFMDNEGTLFTYSR
jgi:hypothetical protein